MNKYGNHPEEYIIHYKTHKATLKNPIIIYHGGFWKQQYDHTYLTPLAQYFSLCGHDVFLPEYPRVGQGKDCLGMIESIIKSYRHITTNLSQAPIVMGHSAGGYYALLLGILKTFHNGKFSNPDFVLPHHIIGLAPVTDLWEGRTLSDHHNAIPKFLECEVSDENKAVYEDFSITSYDAPTSPITLIHGTRDTDVPYEQSQFLCSKWGPNHVKVFKFDTGHMNVVGSSFWNDHPELHSLLN